MVGKRIEIEFEGLSQDHIEALRAFLKSRNTVAQVHCRLLTIEAAYNGSVPPSSSVIIGLTVVLVKGFAITVGGMVARKAIDVTGDLIKEWLKEQKMEDAEVVTLYNSANQPEIRIQRQPVRRVK